MSQLDLFAIKESKKPPESKIIVPKGDGVECRLMLGDCLERMKELDDNSIDAIVTDPPYHRVKLKEAWDNQWGSDALFFEWLDRIAKEWHRLLVSNGSLYCFCSPKLTSRTELLLSKYFNVLNVIRWNKPSFQSRAYSTNKGGLRGFFGDHESIIFCEHYGADNAAKGESGYVAECDKLRGFVFEPLRKYFADELAKSGLKREDVRKFFSQRLGTKGKVSGHFYDRSQWMLPTEEHYNWLRECHNSHTNGDYLRREYEELRREYEELRREYEELRRPFFATPDRPFTATWTFDTVRPRKGKHPCEKPLELMDHIILTSTRPNALVLDSFMGSGSTGVSCVKNGRRFVGVELDQKWIDSSRERLIEAGGKVEVI